jgi:hypothetical protein
MGQTGSLPGVGTPAGPVTWGFAPPYESINRTDPSSVVGYRSSSHSMRSTRSIWRAVT